MLSGEKQVGVWWWIERKARTAAVTLTVTIIRRVMSRRRVHATLPELAVLPVTRDGQKRTEFLTVLFPAHMSGCL